MKLKIYSLYDRISSEYLMTFMSKNDETMKRICMGALISKEQNAMNTDTDDKDIFLSGEYETNTGVIVGIGTPVFILHLSDVRQELLAKIKATRAAAGVNESDGEANE